MNPRSDVNEQRNLAGFGGSWRAVPGGRALLLALLAGSALALPANLPSPAGFGQARASDEALVGVAQPADVPQPGDEAAPNAGAVADDQQPDEPGEPGAAAAANTKPAPAKTDAYGRRIQKDEPTILAFNDVGLKQIIPFLVETTGKVVMPQPDLNSRKITIVNDQPLPRGKALDLVVFALLQAGIAVVETPDILLLRDINEIKQQDVPVIEAEQSVLERTDIGAIYAKVFALRHSTAENIREIVESAKPPWAQTSFDAESNQVVVMGNIGYLQQVERLVINLDTPGAASLTTETFHLQYQDSEVVAQNIRDLYSTGTTSGNNNRQGGSNNPFGNFFRMPGQGGGNQGGGRGGSGSSGSTRRGNTEDTALTSANLRVTANTQQNSVTVLAEKPVIEQIRKHVMEDWDRPLEPDVIAPRVYELKNSDPIKVRDVLTSMFGSSSTATTGGNQNRGGGNNQQNNQQTGGVGRLAGQFSFEALQDSGRILVIAKSPDNLKAMDQIIEQLDQPQTAGLPRIVELKHASAEELAEQLNALLAQQGTSAVIQRQATGLSDTTSNASPFAADSTTTTTTQQTQQTAAASQMQFWWQRGQAPTTFAGASNLISKIRIVPVWRQNALMVMSPPEYSQSMVELISKLDSPGRQVLLSAVIAEISSEDATALGLRWSNSAINPANQDNAISVGANQAGTTAGGVVTGTKNDLLPGLFDTSVLNVGVNLNLLLQALNEKTAVTILSEPRIFTSDNQEASFFNGQDIPFVTDSQTTDNGTLNQSFDYRAVGINLRVRPRITINRDVDLNINLELSSVQPNQTLFGGFIVDRRETTTHLIIRDGQTVVVSGILRTQDSDVKRKVPLLGDIPLLGLIFQSTERTKTNSEIVAFITPLVVENPEESDRVTEPDRAHLKDLRDQLRPDAKDGRVPGDLTPGVEPTVPAAPRQRSNGMDGSGS